MIWHDWEGINLESAHNSQLLFWSLRSEKNAFDVFVKFELGDLRAYFSRNINQTKTNDKL